MINVVWLVWHSARVSGSESQRPSYDDLVARLVEQDARLAERDAERDAVIAALLAEV